MRDFLRTKLLQLHSNTTAAFTALDVDHDTLITANDIKFFLQKFGAVPDETAVESLMRDFASRPNIGMNATEFAQFLHYQEKHEVKIVPTRYEYLETVTPKQLARIRTHMLAHLTMLNLTPRQFCARIGDDGRVYDHHVRRLLEELEGRTLLDKEFDNIYKHIKTFRYSNELSPEELNDFLKGAKLNVVVEEELKHVEICEDTATSSERFPRKMQILEEKVFQVSGYVTTKQVDTCLLEKFTNQAKQAETVLSLKSFIQQVGRQLVNRKTTMANMLAAKFPGESAVKEEELIPFFRNEVSVGAAPRILREAIQAKGGWVVLADVAKTFD